MNEAQQNERVNWLRATLETHRSKISQFLLRLSGMAARVGDNLSVHKKFLRLMEQVGGEREKELEIIDRIESVEKRHHALKKLHLLRRADLEADKKRKLLLKKQNGKISEDDEEEENPERISAIEAFFVYWLFTSRSKFSSAFNFFPKNKLLAGEPMPQPKSGKIEPEIK